ncbi:MAG: TRAP transporter small permease [Bacteriovoracaceae bacterium]|jgi:TRAP-type C4-dicarboxylate transport system permease small subunit|nr:TRAP transporter small permease [Bacteriovoracaceae bacterium]
MIKKTVYIFDRIIELILVTCVTGIIVFSMLNIILRWFHYSFSWIDPLVRHLVFFSAFLGAVLATAADRHIKVDILQRSINKNLSVRKFVTVLNFVIITSVLTVLSYASINFVRSEFIYGKEEFLGIHSSVLTGIIPLGFCLMTIRYLLGFFSRQDKCSL